ncbi:MAG: ATP-dependent endonuclease [Rhizobiaceae bacterium]|nr:ATP-dependent endonuclease [Rhizobiaceae bacterium]
MQIHSIRIENYRSILILETILDKTTAIVGGNNAGKSTVLKAIDLFFSSSPNISVNDYYMHDTSRTISIAIEFYHLTPAESAEFGHAIHNHKLKVVREFGGEAGLAGEYSVFAYVNPDFADLRKERNGTNRRSMYAALRKTYDLPPANGDEIDEALREWERSNPKNLNYTVVQNFFGAKNVALGKLTKKTYVRFVPAVKDAYDEVSDSRKSPVVNLLSEIVKQSIENRKEYIQFIERSNNELSALTDPNNIPQLSDFGSKLSHSLHRYYSDTNLIAGLNTANEISVKLPTPTVNVLHRGLQLDIGQVGHGLQRAILFSIIQFLAEQQSPQDDETQQADFDQAQSDIILLIEEPEIYQHPIKQILFYQAFKDVSEHFNKQNGIRVQIVYATHSEKFIDIVDVDRIRVVSKCDENGEIGTRCMNLSIDDFTRDMASHLNVQPMSINTFRAGLHIFSREISEGFFADKVILVEGVSDREILKAAYIRSGIDPLREGVAIIQCDGKTKIDKPLLAFKKLGIRVYPVFDNDRLGNNKEGAIRRNRLLQSIVGCRCIEDFPVVWSPILTSIDGNLECYLKTRIGTEEYGRIKQQICEHFGVGGNEACKSPAVVCGMLQAGIHKGFTFPLFDEIIKYVAAM